MKKILCFLPFLLAGFISSCHRPEPEVFDETCDNLTFNGVTFSIDGDASSIMTPGSDIYNNYVECIENCSTSDPDYNDCTSDCLHSSGLMPLGGFFTIVMHITNVTTHTITITLEPGTWFFPASDDYQPMFIVISYTITILTGETVSRIVPVYCLASDKYAPDESSDYTICNKAALPCLTKITNILKTKDFTQISPDQNLQIQLIIWNCSEGESVDYDYLNALPPL
jgi:hypothetical protein